MPGEDTGYFDTKDYCVILGEGDQQLGVQLTNALSGLEFAVMHCRNGRDVARWAHQCTHPNDRLVIVSETWLPDISGPEVCRRIRRFGPDYEGVIMFGMSGNPDDESLWRGVSHPGTFIDRSGPDPAMAVSGGVVRNLLYINACQAGDVMMVGHHRYG